MTKKPENHGKTWSEKDEKKLQILAKENTPTRVMGLKLGRTEDAVRSTKKPGTNGALKRTLFDY